MKPVRAPRLPLVASLALALGALSAAPQANAQAPASTHLLVVDQDAAPSSGSAGALFNIDIAAGTSALPVTEASVQLGAPFDLISGVAISPIDGRAYLSDVRSAVGLPARIFAVDAATGTTELIHEGAPLVDPFSLAFMPDGRLLIADPEADPSALGPSLGCGNHGAIFVIDTAACTTPPCAPTLLSDGTLHAFPPTVSVFGEPIGVAYDKVRNTIYVADSCASEVGNLGSLFSVSPITGRVTLVSSTVDFLYLIGVDVRPDGTPLVVDQGDVAGDSVVWTIDLGNSDPESNASQLTGGTQYSLLQDVTVDASNRVYLSDWGDYDTSTGTFIVPPAIWYVDESDTNPGTNGVLVNDSSVFVSPVTLEAVPVPIITSVTPSLITGATNIVIRGTGLFPGATLDLGPGVAVSTVDAVPGQPPGTAIQAVVTPTGTAVVPLGCSGATDVVVSHPFGGTGILAGAVTIAGNTGGIFPLPPASTKGDANDDGIVDGLDLAILGRHFGDEYCDGLAFENDADFNDDDIIDGEDLAILAAYFGVRF